jgi:hypothetical protein
MAGVFAFTLIRLPMDSMPTPTAPMVSERRAALLLGVPRTKVAALVYTGLLRATPVGRTHAIAVSDLERLVLERPDLFPAAA